MNSSHQYFYDLPLGDVYSSTCSAFRLLYFGSELGTFSSTRTKAVDLNHTAAIRIKLSHYSQKPLSEAYDYSLVYYRADLSHKLWHPKLRDKHADIIRMTRRVKYCSQPSLNASRVNLFAIPGNRPIKIAEYDEVIPKDNYVPLHYIEKLHQNFKGFLMRSPKDFPLVRTLFDSMDLSLDSKREVTNPSSKAQDVIIYTIHGD
ncbi:hypothetical protein SAMN02745181_2564 [Rubritalea squalenifaciens DSM 18772]|uniref:Uncharacterized protein n=1 Tax=Rubritalea squalenifaciens DSM 18772 TaxID=1123071 RepID=A0A1M6M0Z2_9BACT|nr:hypothetical protein [Rubritalea squalenifaciens]SHJ77094.1 hypothetical protein SAMN02745181_2564 [Rubritalea squalenifaciens DSM 18772]